MFRSRLIVPAMLFVALVASGAHATVTLTVLECTDVLFNNCPDTWPIGETPYHKLTVAGSPPFKSVRFVAGPVVWYDSAPDATPGWTCEVDRHYYALAPEFITTPSPLDGILCTSPTAASSVTINYETLGKITKATPNITELTSGGSGNTPATAIVLQNEVAITGGDDVPTTIPSIPSIQTWGAMALVLLLLGTMSWFLWPRLRRNETA